MILGIVSIPLACCYVGFLLGAAAIVSATSASRRSSRAWNNGGMALAGIITGAVGVVIEVAIWVLYFAGAASGFLVY